MILAIINGLITSIILETIILMKQNFKFQNALKTALGMSFISMISMEVAMNLKDYLLTGGAMLQPRKKCLAFCLNEIMHREARQ